MKIGSFLTKKKKINPTFNLLSISRNFVFTVLNSLVNSYRMSHTNKIGLSYMMLLKLKFDRIKSASKLN